MSTINSITIKKFRLFQPYENNNISQIGSKKITDQVYKYSTRVSVHDDWIPPKTFFRQWLHPLFGEWTPYFVSTLSTIYIYIYIPIYTHPPRVSISFEITYYSERMAVFEAGMYIVGESSNAIYRPVPWDNRQSLRFDAIPLSPFFHAYRPIPLHLRGLPHKKARNGGCRYRFRCGRCFI